MVLIKFLIKFTLFFFLNFSFALSANKTIETATTGTQTIDTGSNFTVTSAGSISSTTSAAIRNGGDYNIGDILIEGTVTSTTAHLISLNDTTNSGRTAGDITINGTVQSSSSGRGIYLNDYKPNNITIGTSGVLSGGTTLTIHVVDSGQIRGNITNNGTITSGTGYTASIGSNFANTFSNNGNLLGKTEYAVNGGTAASIFNNSGNFVGRFVWGGSFNNTGSLTVKHSSNLSTPSTSGTPAASNANNGFVSSGTINIAVTGKTTAGTDYSSITTTTSNISGIINVDVSSSSGLTVGDVLKLVDGTSTATLGNVTITDNSSDVDFTIRVASNGQDIELVVINQTSLTKPDAIGLIQAWTNTVNKTSEYAIDHVEDRLNWLKRSQNIKSKKTSNQGIDLKFSNKKIDKIVNSTSKEEKTDKISFTEATGYIKDHTVVDLKLKNVAENIVINEFIEAKEKVTGNKGLEFDSDSKLGEWSWYTSGSVVIGQQETTSTSSKLKNENKNLNFGLDRQFNSIGIIGFALMFADDNTDVGGLGSNVSSNSYSLSFYNSYPLENTLSLRTIIGGSTFAFDTKRIDGSQTLNGQRSAKQAYLSLELREDSYKLNIPIDLELYIKGDFTNSELNAFSESGGTRALFFDNQRVKSSHLRLGTDIKNKIENKNENIITYAGLEYSANLTSSTKANMKYVSEDTFYTQTLAPAYDHEMTVKLGVDFYSNNLKFNLSLKHKEQFNSGSHQIFSAGLESKF